MPPKISIALNSYKPNYHSGDTITGKLLLDTSEAKSYSQIAVKFCGSSCVTITETRTFEEAYHDRLYEREEVYKYTSSDTFGNVVVPLWNSQQSPDGNLTPGQYNWPFSLTVPLTVPTSFEGSVGNATNEGCTGYIRYYLMAGNMVSDTEIEKEVEQNIHVQELVKITDPRWLQPVHKQMVDKQKIVHRYLCCFSRPELVDHISMTVTLPKTGFYLGESFQLHAFLKNGSEYACVTMSVRIEKLVGYYAQGISRCDTETILSIESDWIEPQESMNWDPTITIPQCEFVTTTKAENLKVGYTLCVDQGRRGKVCIPLQLGNDWQDEQQAVSTVQPEPPQQQAVSTVQPEPPQQQTVSTVQSKLPQQATGTHPLSKPVPVPPPVAPITPAIAPPPPPIIPQTPPFPFASYSPPLGSQLTD